jgi:hypothetical protein
MPESAKSSDFAGSEGFLSTKFYEDAVSTIRLALTKPGLRRSAGFNRAI